MTDRVITIVDKWAKQYIREDTQSRLAFLDRHKQKFYWGSSDLDNSEVPVEYTQPEIPV